MKHKVVNKQNNSSRCIVCGDKNPASLNTRFYELDSGEILATFETRDHHQSYPGRVHGGMAAAVLDETIGRAICVKEPDTWAVTVELNLKYKLPIPTDSQLKCLGRVTKNTRKIFEAQGEIFLEDGSLAATATGKYLKMPVSDISEGDFLDKEWYQIVEDDPEEIEI